MMNLIFEPKTSNLLSLPEQGLVRGSLHGSPGPNHTPVYNSLRSRHGFAVWLNCCTLE